MAHDCWNDFTKEWVHNLPVSPTLGDLRAVSKYWVVSDAQLKRDLKGRTIADVYRENRALRGGQKRETLCGAEAASAYEAWCKARGHKPHPASIDPDHPIAKQRLGLSYVKRG